jgi:hydrogenase maturation protein HypF
VLREEAGVNRVTRTDEPVQRVRAIVRGAVQGVGFRPFVFRLATEIGLVGWVSNSSHGVIIEVEGDEAQLRQFVARLDRERPPRAFVQSLETSFLDPAGYRGFEIRPSIEGAKTALVLPDIATCPDCLREIFDPEDRRHRYPFTNCTNCGPRFTIIQGLPYDRPKTTMAGFAMCEACRREYADPRNRRFHAQPNACPQCGPHLELWGGDGKIRASRDEALRGAAEAVRQGDILAIKGLGGFHLMVDARRDEAVQKLRTVKAREEKPFALMYPSLDAVVADCEVSEGERRLLGSPEAPIVLLRRRHTHEADTRPRPHSSVVPSVAPRNPYLGVMLPYTPLHHLLMRELGFPVVATSGNLSDEPICTDERDALDRLGGLADVFLVHNRPIARHADDSVVSVTAGRELVLRRARGYAPLPVPLRQAAGRVLAVGAHLKNTVAIAVGTNVFVSQHIGDLETPEAFGAFRQVIDTLSRLYEFDPAMVACDAHPEYLSSQFARRLALPLVTVQHHHAHVLSCMAENEVDGPVLGVSWDGTGYGLDGTVWGGEFLRVGSDLFTRVAHLRTFGLPGGEQAVKEPRRSALGVLYEVLGDASFETDRLAVLDTFTSRELAWMRRMLERRLHTPLTSSAGRLFDAIASIVGLRQRVRFEGQAAMELEFALDGVGIDEAYETRLATSRDGPAIVDWGPLVHGVLDDCARGVAVGRVSAKFHNALAEAIVMVARHVGEPRVVLTGGCFQNRYLTERSVRRLREEGFRPYWHQRVPPNDGGIALGQVVAAGRSRQ